MPAYIALLRGVNVGGNPLQMDWLRGACEGLGLKDVRTYVQSGNLIFHSSLGAVKLAGAIKAEIDAHARLPVTLIIRNAMEIAGVVAGNPFLKQAGVDLTKLHVTFFNKPPENPRRDKLEVLAGDRDAYRLAKSEMFLHCPVNYGQTKLSNTAIEKVLEVGATTRNWKTVTTLLEMATSQRGDS
ncbi:DUF1697 domain-containing protein [soil metagenome]